MPAYTVDSGALFQCHAVQPHRNSLSSHGLGKQIPLQNRTTLLCQPAGLLLGFHAFCDHGHIETGGNIEHGACERTGSRAAHHILHKAFVELELGNGQSMQIAQAGVAVPKSSMDRRSPIACKALRFSSVTGLLSSMTLSVISSTKSLLCSPYLCRVNCTCCAKPCA